MLEKYVPQAGGRLSSESGHKMIQWCYLTIVISIIQLYLRHTSGKLISAIAQRFKRLEEEALQFSFHLPGEGKRGDEERRGGP